MPRRELRATALPRSRTNDSGTECQSSRPSSAPGAGRRRSTSREHLEEVAFDLFARDGFENTSVDAIAAAAGIGRRTLFRYYPSKNDLVWGNFDQELRQMDDWLRDTPAEIPMMEAIRRAVVEFNRVPQDHAARHRQRMGLILETPTLLANSTLRFAQWREVIAGFVATRLGVMSSDLLPQVIGYCALGSAVAAYEQWLAHDGSDLAALLDGAFGELAAGFSHRDQPQPTPR